MSSIGSSIFVKEGVKFDYCFEAAIDSLLLFSDEVVIIECQSEDNTAEILDEKYGNLRKVKLEFGHEWENAPNYQRLTNIANYARSKLTTDWHFMLQADEVVHENSIPYIRQAIKSGLSHAYMCRRYNIWGTLDHYITRKSPCRPCGDNLCRLAHPNIPVFGDAESIYPKGANIDFLDRIKILHYGFVRRGDLLLNKIENMQSFFHSNDGKSGVVDSRVARHREDGYFDPGMKNPDGSFSYGQSDPKYLKRLPFTHPETALQWVEAHRNDPTYKKLEVE
jgi:glycosyltransferase involved in cell wall biosynthesis